MKNDIRQAVRIGITFGLLHCFFVLIGFNSLVGILLAKLSVLSNRE